MNAFVSSLDQVPDTQTQNGAGSFSTSGQSLVDLFAIAGSANAMNQKQIVDLFEKALHEKPDHALRLMLWVRDARGGAGRRAVFRAMLNLLERQYPVAVRNLIPHIDRYGRWDDLLALQSTELRQYAFQVMKNLIENSSSDEDRARRRLLCKWLPRKGSSAVMIREAWGYTPKQYRKTLVEGSSVVETQMCAKQWNSINYSHVPSRAAKIYAKAFGRHDQARYTQWISDVAVGQNGAKVNSAVLYPHEVVGMLSGTSNTSQNQHAQNMWNALPDYLDGNNTAILPVVDVSGSMDSMVVPGVTAMNISTSLGMYLAQRNNSAFRNLMITFHENPSWIKIQGTNSSLAQDCHTVRRSPWGMNTDLIAAFRLILDHAVANSVPANDMPSTLLVISDMEFDQCGSRRFHNATNLQKIQDMYSDHGYKVPHIVFWNVVGRANNLQARAYDANVSLVSGFSPSIMQSVLSAKTVTPLDVVLQTINVERYLQAVPYF